MMTTTKRNTSVVQHTAMIITRPGHQVSSVGQKVDLGAVKREWKNTLILPNQQGMIRYASVTHAVALHQDHRYMQRCYFTFRTHLFLSPKKSISLIGTKYFLSQSPDQVLCVSVITTWYSARRRKALLCYPWKTYSSSAFTMSSCIRFNFRKGYYADKSTFSNPIRGGELGAKGVPTNLYCS